MRFFRDGDSWDSLKIAGELDFSPIAQQLRDGVALVVADFHEEPAAGRERLPCLGDEALVNVQAGGAGVERGFWLVVADLFFEYFIFGNVGRVGNDGVEDFFHHGGEQVRFEEANAGFELVAFGIFAGEFECGGGGVEGGDGGPWQRMSEGQGDGSAACADVSDAKGCGFGEAGEGGFDEVLGFRARDEDIGRHVQGETVEFLFAEDVLDRLVPGAAGEELLICGLLVRWNRVARMREEKDSIFAGCVAQQKLGVPARGGQVLESRDAMVESRAEGHGRMLCQSSIVQMPCELAS